MRWHSLPARVFELVENAPASVLLHCSHPSEDNPYSRLFTGPLRILVARQAEEIPALFRVIEDAIAAGHFAAGFFAYECGTAFEPAARPSRAATAQPLAQPLAWFGIYDRCRLFDHRTGAFSDSSPVQACVDAPISAARSQQAQVAAQLDVTEAGYAERIATIHEAIRAGDVYQLNFTVPMQVGVKGRLAALYARLAERQPVPYGAWVHCEDGAQILSFSPELFFRIEEDEGGRRITTRPMKGTAQRGRTNREDRAQAEWLRNDAKNRAENIMIVDLLRNDLGRLCSYGSVRAEQLFAVERHPTLWQMTSTVSGTLRPQVGFEQIFRALFPCGSITGAPKVRAMQLLAGLEGGPRGVYTGAIGYFSRQKTVFNVAIRTLELEATIDAPVEASGEDQVHQGRMGVGSGIVIDSVAGEEYRECLLKAAFLTGLSESPAPIPDSFCLVETMLWRDGYPLLELHLARLADSAEYFDFAFDRSQIEKALRTEAEKFAANEAGPSAASPFEARKVRLLLDRCGGLQLESEILDSVQATVLRVRLSARRTNPDDPMLFHKTTHRPLYTEEWNAARAAGFDDVLFLNLRGEVTESAIANVFLVKDGRWFTPPLECGLLAGVQRRCQLDAHPEIEKRVLTLADLRAADVLYLTNAVRGLRAMRLAE
jgi:para-aminobenzoate synthetase/4-amino-4-deoxychorismate lyase